MSLVAHYRLDEATGDAIDQIAANNAAINGAVQHDSGGHDGGYVSFADTNSIIASAIPAIALCNMANGFSFSFWAKWSGVGGSGNGQPWNKRHNLYTYSDSGSGSRLRMLIQYDVTECSVISDFVSYNVWHHIVCIHDPATLTSKIYVDGTETSYAGNTAGEGTLFDDSTRDFVIGNSEINGTRFWEGGIDDMRLYDHQLSEIEITDLYTGSATSTPVIAGVDDDTIDNGQAIVITGTDFDTATVELNSASDGSGESVNQTINSQNSTEINITADHGALTGTAYLIVTNGDTQKSNGFEVTLNAGSADCAWSPAQITNLITSVNNLQTTVTALQTDITVIRTITDNLNTGSEVADSVLDGAIEGTTTLRQILRGIFAVLAGLATNDGNNFRDIANTKNRITATTDGAGNRTEIILDLD